MVKYGVFTFNFVLANKHKRNKAEKRRLDCGEIRPEAAAEGVHCRLSQQVLGKNECRAFIGAFASTRTTLVTKRSCC